MKTKFTWSEIAQKKSEKIIIKRQHILMSLDL